MLYGNVLGIVFSVIGFLMSLQGVWLVSAALWPRRVSAASRRIEKSLILPFLVGAVMTIVLAVIIRVATRTGSAGQVVAGLIALIFLIYAGVGMSGLVTLIGRRMSSPVDLDRPWKATIRGGLVMEMAYLFPVLGWFGLLPISLIIGAGATTLGFFDRSSTPADGAPPIRTDLPRRAAESQNAAERDEELVGASR